MKLKLLLVIMFAVLLVTACGPSEPPEQDPTPDIAAVRTSAAGTVIAQFTLTAAAFTPTPAQPTDTATPEVTNTATAPFAQVTDASGTVVSLCDSLDYVADVNVPDDTDMSPGQDFVKTWRVRNSGSCPWGEGYTLVYAGYANEMSGQAQPLNQVVQPGQEVEVSVQFTAPSQIGEYLSAWQMSNPAGVTFEDIIFVRIIVQ